MTDETDRLALAGLTAVDADEVAEAIEWELREADADQLADRAGPVHGRGYVEVNKAASEILEELLQPVTDDLARSVRQTLAIAGVDLPDDLLEAMAADRDAA